MTRALAIAALLLSSVAVYGGTTQRSSLHLRQDQQFLYWPRYNARLSGRYRGSTWVPSPERATYGDFRGGGPGAGK